MSKVRRQAIGVALFPFLAVLICTMGALIVLLVLLVQQASLDAQEIVKERARAREQAAVDPLAAERKVAREKVEDEEWRRGILEAQRTERVDELANARLKVSHLADHIRRLQEQAQSLMARATEIDRGQTSQSPDLTADQTELTKLQAEIARKKAELDAKKKELAAKEKSYALIPYDGPNGTKRRPIYIECTRHGVVLQPEGLILGPDDFNGPLNPGNPLDAGIRAIREAWVRSGEPGEPYPLLVVRPDGIVAYQYARQALRGYDEEFGYELVGDDKKLDYGKPNPAMQRVLEQVVGSARQRQVMLAAAMPKKFQGEDTVVSFAAEDQPSFQQAVAAADASGGTGYGPPGTGGGQPGGVGKGPAGAGGSGTGSNNFPGINTQFSASNNSVVATRAVQGGTGYSATGTGAGNGTGNGSGNGFAGTGTAPGGYAANGPGGLAGQAGGQPGGQAGSPGGQAGGNAAGGATGAAGQMAGAMNSGSKGGTGQTGSSQTASAQGSSDQNAAAGGTGQAGATGGTQGGSQSGSPADSPSSSSQQQPSATSKQPQKGGAGRSGNWGLPASFGKTTAVTRPIRIVCLPDRLVVVPDRGDDRAASVIGTSPQLQPAEVDAFVAAVQKRLTSWGPAMTNGFWKPVLQVEVSRGAEPQFETLQMLLQGSGFEVQRKAQ
jgi:hypothetical protein